MARIRTIKPEVWEDEKFGVLTDLERVVWFNRVTQADDAGRFVATSVSVSASISPFQPPRPRAVEKALQALDDAGLIVLYEVNGCRYGYFPAWGKHQRIDRPQPAKYPTPNGTTSHPPNHSSNGSTNGSSNRSASSSTGDRKGRDRKGSKNPPSPLATKGGALSFDAKQDQNGRLTTSEVFDVWNDTAAEFGLPKIRAGRAKLLPKVRAMLKDLGEYGTESVLGIAFDLFAKQDLVQQKRYSLANFLPNYAKYTPEAIERRDGDGS